MKSSLPVILIFLLTGCAPKAITYFLEEEARLEQYQTYRILNTKLERTNLSKDGREVLDILELAIREKMRERGFEESNLGPDVILRYEIVTNQFTEGSNNGPFGPPVSSRTFMESLIIIDLLDAERRKMFWQSSYDMRQENRDIKQEQAVERAVSEIFFTFPYKAGSREVDEKLADYKSGRKKLKARQKEEKKAQKKLEKQQRKERNDL